MILIFGLAGIVVVFSLLSTLEIYVLKRMGLDIVGHLKISSESDPKTRFYFEAFGAAAFLIGQPIVLTGLLAWLISVASSEFTNPQGVIQTFF